MKGLKILLCSVFCLFLVGFFYMSCLGNPTRTVSGAEQTHTKHLAAAIATTPKAKSSQLLAATQPVERFDLKKETQTDSKEIQHSENEFIFYLMLAWLLSIFLFMKVEILRL